MYPFLGIGLSVLIINLLMYLTLRKRTYLPYILFHISLVFLLFSVTGHFARIFFIPHGGWAQYIPLFIGLSSFTFVWFSAWYFDKSIYRHPFFAILSLTTISNVIVWLFDGPTFLSEESVVFLVLLVVIYAAFQWRKNKQLTFFFLMSWGGYLVFTIVYTMQKNGLIPTNDVMRYSVIIAHVWEMTFFTVALANQVISELTIANKNAKKSEKSKK